jgi:hypothetical protein
MQALQRIGLERADMPDAGPIAMISRIASMA